VHLFAAVQMNFYQLTLYPVFASPFLQPGKIQSKSVNSKPIILSLSLLHEITAVLKIGGVPPCHHTFL